MKKYFRMFRWYAIAKKNPFCSLLICFLIILMCAWMSTHISHGPPLQAWLKAWAHLGWLKIQAFMVSASWGCRNSTTRSTWWSPHVVLAFLSGRRTTSWKFRQMGYLSTLEFHPITLQNKYKHTHTHTEAYTHCFTFPCDKIRHSAINPLSSW